MDLHKLERMCKETHLQVDTMQTFATEGLTKTKHVMTAGLRAEI